MKFINIILIITSLFLGLVSCNERRTEMEQGQGYLDLRVSLNLNVDVVPVTKSGNSEDVISVCV